MPIAAPIILQRRRIPQRCILRILFSLWRLAWSISRSAWPKMVTRAPRRASTSTVQHPDRPPPSTATRRSIPVSPIWPHRSCHEHAHPLPLVGQGGSKHSEEGSLSIDTTPHPARTFGAHHPLPQGAQGERVTECAASASIELDQTLAGPRPRQTQPVAAGRPLIDRQCAMKTGSVALARMWRVAPPKINCLRRLCV